MIKRKIVKKEISEKESIVCDICGKEYSYDTLSILDAQEFISIHRIGGYGSIFGDGHPINMDICQHCFKKYVWDKINETKKN